MNPATCMLVLATLTSGPGCGLDEDLFTAHRTGLLLHLDGEPPVDACSAETQVTATGVDWLPQGRFGGSAAFNGAGQIALAHNASWDFSTLDFTLDFWLRVTAWRPAIRSYRGRPTRVTSGSCRSRRRSRAATTR